MLPFFLSWHNNSRVLVRRTRLPLVHETISNTPKGRPDFRTLNPVLQEILMTQDRVFDSDTDGEQLHYTFAGN